MIKESVSGLNAPGLFHGYMMTSAWIGFELFGIWSLNFRNRSKKAQLVHSMSMLFLIILSVAAASEIILDGEGTKALTKHPYHNTVGFVITCIVPFVACSGIILSFKQICPNTTPKRLDEIKLSHKIMGWLLISASRIPMYNKWINKIPNLCIVLLIFDIISHTLYFYYKMNRLRMQSIKDIRTAIITQTNQQQLRQIKTKMELQIYKGDYFIFDNYVFRLGPVLTSHPGGYQLIESIKQRQVDRFIYGNQSSQFFQNSKISHSVGSIKLAGPPIAKIQSSYIFPNMEQLTKVNITASKAYYFQNIHLIYLQPQKKNKINKQIFYFPGYRDISQLGKYFILKVNNKARLYSGQFSLSKKFEIFIQFNKMQFCSISN